MIVMYEVLQIQHIQQAPGVPHAVPIICPHRLPCLQQLSDDKHVLEEGANEQPNIAGGRRFFSLAVL